MSKKPRTNTETLTNGVDDTLGEKLSTSSNIGTVVYTVEIQWLEHRCLVYHGCFELALESGKKPIAADLGKNAYISIRGRGRRRRQGHGEGDDRCSKMDGWMDGWMFELFIDAQPQ